MRPVLLQTSWVILTAAAIHGAAAQDVTGIRAGSFLFQPSASASVEFDSNFFLSETDPEQTIRTQLAPRLEIRSDWNRHAIKLSAGAQAGFHTHDSADDFIDYDFEVAGELDITRNAQITGRISTGQSHEARGTPDAPASLAEPVTLVTAAAEIEGNWRLQSFRLNPFASWTLSNFEDVSTQAGAIANQDDRDRVELEAGLELGYRISRGYEAFLRGSVLSIDYEADADDSGLDRDSEGWRVLGGVKLRLTRLIEGSAAVGFVTRDFADPALETANTASASLGLDWRPTRRLLFSAEGRRDIDETTFDGAAAAISTTIALGSRYELLRPLILTGDLAFTRTNFEGSARTDNLFQAGFGAEWVLRRGVKLIPSYSFALRESSAPGFSYQAHSITLTGAYDF